MGVSPQVISGIVTNGLIAEPRQDSTDPVVTEIVSTIADQLAMGKNVGICLDLDKSTMHPEQAPGLIAAAPDAWFKPDLKNIITDINEANNCIAFVVTGRSTTFAREELGLHGSGQFHAEMNDIFTGQHSVLKEVPDLTEMHAFLTGVANNAGGFLEDDKSHHLCVMVEDATAELVEAVTSYVNQFNEVHGSEFVVEHGSDFCEVGPEQTCKAQAYRELTEGHAFFDQDNCFELYFGDTPDKDGPAMSHVQSRGGMGIAVGQRFGEAHDFTVVESPEQTYQVLKAVRALTR